MKQKMLLLAAVFFGVLAFMFTYQQLKMERSKIMGSASEIVLIRMKTELSEGEKISEDAIEPVKVQRFTNSAARSYEIPWNRSNEVLGLPAAMLLKKGDILTWHNVKSTISSGRSGLALQTRNGYRAVSIPVSSVSSVSGLIKPNNIVDIIGTFHFPDAKGDASLDTVTMTVLQRVKVLACGSDLGYTTQGQQAQMARSYSTVTLELTPKEAEMIIFASQKGSLTLVLRSYDDPNFTHEVQSVDWAFLQKNIEGYNAERESMLSKPGH